MLIKWITLLSALVSVGCYAFWLGGGTYTVAWLFVIFAVSWVGLLVLSFLALWALCLAIDPEKPRQADSPFYRRLGAIYIEALIQLCQAQVTAEHLDLLPAGGRFLLVCNHNSMADPGILLHHMSDRQLAFISKQENQHMFIIGRLMHAMLCQRLDREDDRAALTTIRRCIQILNDDLASIAVFPEGATNRDALLHPLRPGVFKIAQRTGVPIVICTLSGTRPLIPNGLRLRPTPITLRVLEVMAPEQYAGMKTTQLAAHVYDVMARSLGEDSLAKTD